jgi:glycosyltransferase involved in cell wall biosynthesis
MNLLHVINDMDSKQGGVSQAVRTIIVGLTAEGVHSEVACLDTSDAPWNKADSFPVHALGPGRGPWSYSSKLIPWLLDNLSRFDVVVLHGLWLYQSYALGRALHRLKVMKQGTDPGEINLPQLFIMPHGMLDPYFQRAAGRRLKAWRNQLYWQLIESDVVNQAGGLFFTCETERLLAHEPFSPYKPKCEVVVGLGVEKPPIYSSAMRDAFTALCPELQNRPYLLFLSRIHEKKGVDLLLKAFAHTIRDLAIPKSLTSASELAETDEKPSQAPVLVIAGPGIDTSYGQLVYQLAAKLPKSTVLFPGMLTGDAKWAALYGCEAFVLPSHQENFGIAVVEALACCKPVLISNQVNIWREIETTGGG